MKNLFRSIGMSAILLTACTNNQSEHSHEDGTHEHQGVETHSHDDTTMKNNQEEFNTEVDTTAGHAHTHDEGQAHKH